VTHSPAQPATLPLGERAADLLAALALITDEPGRITRTYLSPAHDRALDLIGGWMAECGLAVGRDAVATLRGRRPADVAAERDRTLYVGSHVDSVIDAGRFDGCLGVIAALVAIEEIDRRGLKLPFALEVLAFGDEEGVRFPIALSSSAAAAGLYRPEWLEAKDRDGISVFEALHEFGADPNDIDSARIDATRAVGWLELHIEQGPQLEHWGVPLGVVSSIAGQSRFALVIGGTAGHAGTVPMALRRDALAGLAEMVGAIERIALAGSDALVATVGRVSVSPGTGNTVPGRVEASLDVRAGRDAPRLAAIERISAECRAIADRRGLDLTITPLSEDPTCPMDPGLQDAFGRSLVSLGLDDRRLPSGAGHDAMVMARVMPAGMLFVRSIGGISHNPREWTTPEDIGLCVEALIRTIVDLAGAEENAAP
jgi:allantoate deiminase